MERVVRELVGMEEEEKKRERMTWFCKQLSLEVYITRNSRQRTTD